MNEPHKLEESELEERFSHASGPGGQNVQKVATRVTLRHKPTDLSVTVQDSRSQAQNRQIARERLLALLKGKEAAAARVKQQALEKERRRKSPRPAGLKARLVEAKRRRSRLKKQRAKGGEFD